MADIAIGISKAAVEALVSKVKDAIKEEAEKWQIVRQDFVFIKDEFETMQSFLSTSAVKRVKSNIVRIWVRQVRDLSYDVEDCIEFVIHLDTKRSLWRRLLPSCRAGAPLPLDEVIAEIKLLKARVQDVSLRNLRYGFITDEPRAEMLEIPAASTTTSDLDIFIKPKDALENGILDLASLITREDEGLQVISIFGTGGGLGTLSVIQKMYDSLEIRQMFSCCAWVKLMHPLNLHEVIQRLGAQFIQEQGVGENVLTRIKATEDDLAQEFMKRTGQDRYLIVLEDLCSMQDWNAIRRCLPDMRKGSRIVVSTQQVEIASLCTGQPYQASLILQFSSDHCVYAFSKDTNLEHPQALQLEDKLPSKSMGPSSSQDRASRWLQEQQKLAGGEECILGRQSEVRKLEEQIKLASSGEAHNVVSVCGIAGVGKTYVVKTVYYRCRFHTTTIEKYAWVNAPDPFKIVDFCQSLIYHLSSTSTEVDDVVLQCWKLLDEHQCLVVIDELKSKEDWDQIKSNLVSRTSRSCIIVISRDESVARHCATTEDAVCSVNGLEADAALRLFEKVITGKAGASNLDTSMMVEAGHIINKCGRLPQLIVALGSYLANGLNVAREIRRLNANFIYELKTSRGLDSFQDVLRWMYSTFEACPQLLKKCIFYLSLFTQSSMIRRKRLVMRWIAEGYSEGTDSISMVEYTEEIVRKLATLCLIGQPPPTSTAGGDMKMTSCHVNSLFLDYIISRETEETVFLPLEVSVLQGGCSLNGQQIGQHLAIGSGWNRDKFVLDSFDFSRLRSLTVSRDWRPFFISHTMRVVRVLDLEDTNVNNDDVQQIVEQLHRLKFLSLRRCTRVSCLPASLGELKQLQTLDIRHTSVAILPSSISKLRNLQYFRGGCVELDHNEPSARKRSRYGHVDACDGVKVPQGTEELMALHTLGVINVSAMNGKSILQGFKNLTQLRKLGISGISRRNIKTFFSAIVGHGHLECLFLQLHMDKDLDWLGKITPRRNLRRLKMYVQVDEFQHWSCLQVLGQIRRLQTLRLRFKTDKDVVLQFCDWQDGAAWPTPGQFCELKVLEISCSTNLHVKFAEGEMKELELLNVRCFGRSSLNFSGLEHTISLKHVLLNGSFVDALKEELRQKVVQHPNRPVMKLEGPSPS